MSIMLILLGYLLGSLPFGYILTRLIQRTDIRQHGSGNIGATNVLRLMGWKAALPVFLLDLLKGTAAVLIARALYDAPEIYLAAGLAAMVGHSFPIFLRFKGGKAVATGIGVLLALSVWATLILIVFAVAVIASTRYVSLGSILSAAAVPVLFYFFGEPFQYILFGLLMAALVLWRHRENISRLLKGTESKLGQKVSLPTGEM